MIMFILAGGFGTRLQKVLHGTPKPLAPIGDKPFLYYQIQNWKLQGLNSFVFLLHHKASLIENFLEQQSNKLLKGCDVKVILERQPLDTGGAVANGVKKLKISEDILVSNADTWSTSGITNLTHSSGNTILVVKHSDVSRFGSVHVDSKGLVNAFVEKGKTSGEGIINAGTCKLDSRLFNQWTKKRFSLETDIFPSLAKANKLNAILINSKFIDIGVPSDYEKLKRWVLSKGEEKKI